MCKSHITVQKFLKLLFEIEFYSVIIYAIFALTGYQKFTLLGLLKAVMPIKNIDTGFASTFLVFYLFIPFLNILLKNLNEKMHLRLVALCLFIYTILGTIPKFPVTMNYVSWFIVIYFIASYVRLYPKALFDKTKFWGLAAIACLFVSSLSIILSLYFGFGSYSLLSDSNRILAVVTAFCAFMFFKNVSIPNNRFINTVASATFGVLLIHANSDTMRQWLWKDTLHNVEVFNTSWCYLRFICSALGVYVICTCIDLIRIYCLEKSFFMFYDKKSPMAYNWFYS